MVVETEFTGAHLYHLSAAACVLNDVYRESIELGVVVEYGSALVEDSIPRRGRRRE